jgi:hypothetical protein
MKTVSHALGTTENEFGSTKYENGTRCPRYRWKRVMARKSWKQDPTPSVPPKMSPGAQNMKTGIEALGTAEKEFGGAKHEKVTRRSWHHRKWVREHKTWKRDTTPSLPPKMSPGAQIMKTGPDTLGNGETNPERKTWKRDLTPSVTPKMSPGAQNMKTGTDALGIVENESGRAKHENETRRTWHRRKWVREHKTWKMGTDALGTAENESWHAKHKNRTRRPRYRQKYVRERQT